MKEEGIRLLRLLSGLFLYALGSYMGIQANIGLAPWEAFSIGIMGQTGIGYGNVVVLTSVLILGLDVLAKETIGWGTLLNAVLIGKFVDLIAWFGLVPRMEHTLSGAAMLLGGQVVICVGSYFYISAALGCGPRDALMVAIGKRLPRVPIGAVRFAIEGTVLVIGWLLGAKVGLGTVISVLGIGFILQGVFRLFRFRVTDVKHETLPGLVRRYRALFAGSGERT